MIPEDRLRQMLRQATTATAGTADPSAVIRRLQDRRRRRLVARTTVGALAVAALTVSASTRATDRHEVTTAAAPGRPPRPSTQLVALSTGRATFVDAANGEVVRTLGLSPVLPGPPDGSVGIDPTGRTAYVSVAADVSCSSDLIIAVDLSTGHTRQVGRGIDPALSTDGSRLAYLQPSAATDQPNLLGPSCDTATLIVDDLRESRPLAPARGPFHFMTNVTSVAWSAGDTSLILGYQGSSGVEVFDTRSPVGATNPSPVPTHGYFRDPVSLGDGRILAYGPTCGSLAGCPTELLDIVVLDPRTGQQLRTLYVAAADSRQVPYADLLVDPSGTRVATLVRQNDFAPAGGVAVVENGTLHQVATDVGYAVAWVPVTTP